MILIPEHKIAEYTDRGWWGTTTLWDLFQQQVAQRPDAEAVVDAANRADFAHGEAQRLTWGQLSDAVDRFCRVLLDTGIRRDEILLMQLPNGVEQYIVYLSCARLGIVVTPVPVQYRENELDHILAHTQAAAVVTFARIGKPEGGHAAAAMFAQMQAHAPHLRSILAWGDEPASGCIDLSRDCAAAITPADTQRLAQAEREAAVTANDVFTICWTSGTEARPKGVPRSHNEWLVVAPSIIEAGQIGPQARLLNPFPLVNMAGISTAIAAWLVVGGTVVQHHPFSLPVFLQQIRDERIDYTVAPPAVLNMLLQNTALLEGIDFQRLSRIGSGSAPLSEWMVRGFAEQFGVQIINYFGSNEGAALAGSDIDLPDPGERATFFPRAGVPGFEWSVSTTRKIRTRLVDLDTGEDIAQAGHIGELRFTGPTIFSGYYGAPEMTARAFDEQGYYKTGDLFEIAGDRQQFYRYAGRSKDLVIRGGMNISAEEIEGLLLSCPGVREVAVVGVPDAVLGERVCVCVVGREGQPPALVDLVRYLRTERHVAAYKLPEYLLPLAEMPRNPVGKILKTELRAQARSLVGSARKEMA
ncbi:MAG: acyl--CoA ligase [Rhodoferax sp.]|jgi:acyl-CoA synthetase (AMP-forming)/AMP-acid ligase II|nr:acyl--CoA ligase [Rhodoferax sp.]